MQHVTSGGSGTILLSPHTFFNHVSKRKRGVTNTQAVGDALPYAGQHYCKDTLLTYVELALNFPSSFSAELHPRPPISRLYHCRDCSTPSAQLCICLFWTSWHFCQPIPLCWGPSEQQPCPPMYEHSLNLASSPKMTKVFSVPMSMSLMKALNSISLQGISLAPGCHSD